MRALAGMLLAGVMGGGPLICAAQTMRLEAETASLSGPNIKAVAPEVSQGRELPANFSGSGYVTGFQSDADEAVFHPKVKTGGLYKLLLRYRANGQKGYEIEVNDLKLSGMIERTPVDRFGEQALGTVELEPGKNTIAVHKGWGFYDVDYIDLTPLGPVSPPARPWSPPSDPQVSAEARGLLMRLDDAYGKTSMVGVYKDRDAQYVLDQTGARPSIMGADLLAYSPQETAHGTHPEKEAEVERLIARARERSRGSGGFIPRRRGSISPRRWLTLLPATTRCCSAISIRLRFSCVSYRLRMCRCFGGRFTRRKVDGSGGERRGLSRLCSCGSCFTNA